MNNNKYSLSKAVSKITGRKQYLCLEVLNFICFEIAKQLDQNKEVQLRGFGTFKIKNRTQRPARNIRTGEQIILPACRTPKFKPHPDLIKAACKL